MSQGLINSGCSVIELEGVCTSPQLYFASSYLKANGAIMITGSHNNLEYNGFKFMLEQKSFYGEELRSIINNLIMQGTGSHNFIKLDNEYAQALMKSINITKNFKIAWECNNSGIAKILKLLKLPGIHLYLNTETDGKFAHELPDPLIEKTLDQIKQIVISEQCDYGFAFDGDGDRLVMLNSKGQVLSGDQLIYLLALSFKNSSNKKILLDIKASNILIEFLEELGFEVILAASGHSLMKTRIVKEKALLALELSGHIVINDSKYLPFDDALYVALRLIEYLQNNPIVFLPLAAFRQEYKIPKTLYLNPQIYKPEGLRKSFNDGFYLIRASNTEDYILVKYEALNQDIFNLIEEEIEKILNSLL